MPLDLTDDKSTLVQVMAWCRQATSHHLSQCWPRSMLPNDVTRPQRVNSLWSSYGCMVKRLLFLVLVRALNCTKQEKKKNIPGKLCVYFRLQLPNHGCMISLTIFYSNSNSMECSFRSHLKRNEVIATKFCTWQSTAQLSGNKPLPEPMLIRIPAAIWHY